MANIAVPCVFQVPIKLEVPIVLDLAVAAKQVHKINYTFYQTQSLAG